MFCKDRHKRARNTKQALKIYKPPTKYYNYTQKCIFIDQMQHIQLILFKNMNYLAYLCKQFNSYGLESHY